MFSSKFAPKTQEIINALAAIPKHEYRCDKATVAACFAEHFRLLGMKPLPIRWVDDAQAGYEYVTKIASAAWSAAESAAWSAARSAAWSAARSVLRPVEQRLQQSALTMIERMIAVEA